VVRVLTDQDVRARLSPTVAVGAARRALIDAYEGRLLGPPRLHADLGALDLVFTVGGYHAGWIGFRVYGTWPGDSDQAVLLWGADGRLRCCLVGAELGARRTGALGAAAVASLARADASVAGVIGSGRQAWAQLWAMTAVRDLVQVRVFSPSSTHRAAFSERATHELGLSTTAVDDPHEAVRGAGIVVLATDSTRPVIRADWIEPGTHVSTVGPKSRDAHETPPELADIARVIVSDSPAQAAAYHDAFFTDRDLTSLGAVLLGREPGRTSLSDITLYCSTGLAGSEVVVAGALVGDMVGK
jgi:ornithine cyclodeaminase/alanine dehydrogenase-like protein (mu-crystallin family)